MKIALSYLSVMDFLKEENEKKKEIIQNIKNSGVDFLHMDIMDGKFVSNETIDVSFLENFKELSLKKDIHLMVKDISFYVSLYQKFSPEYMTFHIEGNEDVKKNIDIIRASGSKVGIALNPNTDIDFLKPYLSFVDLVLVMSVEAGCGGQRFIDITDKIQKLKDIRDENSYSYIIEVDGGIKDENIALLKDADMVVVGSFITNGLSYQNQVEKLRRIVE